MPNRDPLPLVLLDRFSAWMRAPATSTVERACKGLVCVAIWIVAIRAGLWLAVNLLNAAWTLALPLAGLACLYLAWTWVRRTDAAPVPTPRPMPSRPRAARRAAPRRTDRAPGS